MDWAEMSDCPLCLLRGIRKPAFVRRQWSRHNSRLRWTDWVCRECADHHFPYYEKEETR